MITIRGLRELRPCQTRFRHLLQGLGDYTDDTVIGARQLVELNGASDFLWLAIQLDDYRQLARECLADIAEHVLPIFEAKYPDDNRPRKCIEALRAYTAGTITREALTPAAAAANAAWAAAFAARAAAATYDAAATYAAYAARAAYDADAARAAYAADDATWAARAAADDAAAAEREWQKNHTLSKLEVDRR